MGLAPFSVFNALTGYWPYIYRHSESEYLFLGKYIPLIYLHILKQGPSVKRLGLISWANNDDIGICKIWRKDGKFHQFELQSESKDDHQQ